ncbi:Rieske 2Fe-2S domain-containing protein [Paenibacillus sp. 1P03SA]|uniref:Rieske 2Fe-2S domain-containing protein n=1 Tax=Paenibacillus sp. 1P03SA TaxID=3132294 RepID=UPI0039A071B8
MNRTRNDGSKTDGAKESAVYKELQNHWLPLCPSQDLKRKPLGLTVLDVPLVLFRTKEGVHALLDRCPHRNVPLSGGWLKEEKLVCPYHGWEFDGTGACTRVPGLCTFKPGPHHDATPVAVLERDGFVWGRLGEGNAAGEPEGAPGPEPLPLPFMNDPEYYSFVWKTAVRGSLLNAAENLLDATHTHYVHAGLIRTDSGRQTVNARIRAEGAAVEIEYTGESGQAGLISRLFERDRQRSCGRFFMPGVAQIEYGSAKGLTLLITAVMRPTSYAYQDVYAVITMKRGRFTNGLKKRVLTPFLKKALNQDIAIVETQQRALERWGGESFRSTQADLIRPYLEQLIKGKIYEAPYEKKVQLFV